MPEVYNTTTVEFQNYPASPREHRFVPTVTKYGLAILGGISIGIGVVVAIASFLANESPSWLLFGLGIVLLTIGIVLVTFWKFWSSKGRGFTVLKPRVKGSIVETDDVTAREEEFVNQDGLSDLESNAAPSPEQSHYKPRHFSQHGYGKKPAGFGKIGAPVGAPLAQAEDITPSLRSSYSSLAYIKEYDSESSGFLLSQGLTRVNS